MIANRIDGQPSLGATLLVDEHEFIANIALYAEMISAGKGLTVTDRHGNVFMVFNCSQSQVVAPITIESLLEKLSQLDSGLSAHGPHVEPDHSNPLGAV